MIDLFTVTVPDEELEAPQGIGEPIQAGEYATTLQPGTELVSNDSGWAGLRIPFEGFESNANTYPGRPLTAQFTYAHATSAQAVEIGTRAIMGLARTLGLAEQTGMGWKLTATSPEELVAQINGKAGSRVGVYVNAKKSKNLKRDGTPFIDNEIRRVFAL